MIGTRDKNQEEFQQRGCLPEIEEIAERELENAAAAGAEEASEGHN